MSLTSPVVYLSRTSSVRGKTVYARECDKPVNAFLGIPYAEPPVGDRRFRVPVAKTLWQGQRDCTEFGPICPQHSGALAIQIYPYPVPEMSEDCLCLNVWTPTLNENACLPVMLWIHGGGFTTGLSNVYDGTTLASFHDVVFISINYRVASLGFMCTGDSESPGNYGLLDQVEAMRWTRRFISKFGGDPNNVTIFGESAGGISVSFHMLSDLSRDLFKRGILQSGVTCYPGDVWTRQQCRKYITKSLQKLGFTFTSTKDLVQHLRSMPAKDLGKLGIGFSPVVDGFFIKDTPLSLYRSKQFQTKECMLGFNSDEGATFAFASLGRTSVDSLEDARKYVDKIVKTSFFRGNKNADAIVQLIVNEYLSGVKDGDSRSITRALVDFHGELLFVAPIIRLARMHSASAKTYMYLFKKRPSVSRWPDWISADHSQDIFYVLGIPFNQRIKPETFNSADRAVSRVMMQYWTNFARYGDPNGHNLTSWPMYGNENAEKLLVIDDNVETGEQYRDSRMDFWNNVIDNMRRTASKY